MNIYTKNGDKGTTDLLRTKNVSKSDDRLQLVGTIDELSCHLGLIKTMVEDKDILRILEKIQGTLEAVMAGVNDPYNREYKLNDDKTELLESEIDRMEPLCDSSVKFVFSGKNRLSAQIDVARAVARRAERALASVSVKFGADTGAKKYLNRLADYLYVLSRYAGAAEKKETEALNESRISRSTVKESANAAQNPAISENVIQEVLKRMGIQSRITLDGAKRLIEKIEAEAAARGMKAAIAICGPDGNPVAVHVMDGAFLVSFDAAMKKAYTSVAVKMSSLEFGKLAQPGGTFYGADKLDGGKIVIFGGGVPIKVGDNIVGGIGVSGGTGEEDHSLAEYGASVYSEIM